MAVRKWLIRGVLLVLTLATGGAYYVYGQYTNPEAVARMVLAELKQHFPEADVQLGRAEWRLFGGVRLNELRVTPIDRRGLEPTAQIRQTVLQIDKAQAARGRFELHKVHLEHPQLNLERDEDGRWNVLSLLTAKPNAAGTIPFVTLHDGVIRFHDKKLDFPILDLTAVEAKLVPQPQGVLTGEGSGHSDLLGPIAFRFVHQPKANITELTFSVPGVEYQPRLETLIVKLIPNWKEQQIRLQGRLGVETKLTWLPDQDIPTIESAIHLQSGELRHPHLPVALQNIKAQIDYSPDKVTLTALHATAGKATITGRGRVHLAGDPRGLDSPRLREARPAFRHVSHAAHRAAAVLLRVSNRGLARRFARCLVEGPEGRPELHRKAAPGQVRGRRFSIPGEERHRAASLR
jgi:hypothetical protein